MPTGRHSALRTTSLWTARLNVTNSAGKANRAPAKNCCVFLLPIGSSPKDGLSIGFSRSRHSYETEASKERLSPDIHRDAGAGREESVFADDFQSGVHLGCGF